MTAIGIGIGIPFGGAAVDPTVDTLIAMFGGGATGGALYDPSDTSTGFVERASPSTASGNGDLVGTLNDLSGNDIPAISNADAKRPTLTQAGALWYLAYASAHNLVSTWGSTISQPHTIVMAVQPNAANDYYCDGVGASNRCAMYGQTGEFRMFAGSILSHATAEATGSPLVFTGVFNGASSKFRVNGTETTGDPGAQTHTGTIWGERYASDIGLNGRIYFAMEIHRALTTSEIAAAESVAAAKCGITI